MERSPGPLEALANTISASASIITDFLRKGGHAQPSFSVDGPSQFPSAPDPIIAARADLLAAARRIQCLALWPTDAIRWYTVTGAIDASTLRWIYHFNVAQAVPLVGSISFADIASKTGINVRRLTHVLRYAMTNNIFCEPEPGHVAHTALSALIVNDKPVWGAIGNHTEVVFPAVSKLVEATEKYGESEDGIHSSFNVAFNTSMRSIEWVMSDPVRSERFAESMKSGQQSGLYNTAHLVNGFNWGGLEDGLVVDVGGSAGGACIAIAKKAPRLNFIVQDQPEVVKKGNAELPEDIRGRLTFMTHDFFHLNPVEGADVFLLRLVLHDWPDDDAIRILKNIAVRMTATTRLIICETVVPEPGTIHPLQEKYITVMDMIMLSMFNALERSLSEWENLIQRADPMLQIIRVETPVGSNLSVIEIVRQFENRSS